MNTSGAYRIDVHHHFFPPEYLTAIADRLPNAQVALGWSRDRAIEDMDQGGVATSVTSITTPGVWFGDIERGRKLARLCNEYAARLVDDYPGRYGFWASLPLPDTEGSLRELDYALGVLKADGVGLFTSYGDKWLGDPAFDPVFEELNRRRVTVYTHPTTAACCGNLVPGIADAIIEYGTDTTRAIGRMLFSGAAARFPDARLIFSHAGGTLPFLYERFERASANRGEQLPDGLLPALRRFYYDLAQASHPTALASFTRIIPVSQMLFGTDFPYRNASEFPPLLRQWSFSPADLAAIEYENALSFLPRIRAYRAAA
jgi:6-methylsalicylate decarboxylase